MTDTMKKLAAALLAACALCLATAGTAWAAAEPQVELEAVEGADEVSVSLERLDDASALRLTLAVSGDLDAVDVDFAFDGSLDGAAVRQARYSRTGDAGRLNLYVAGAAGLIGDASTLGRVKVSGGDGAQAAVSVAALSLVNASYEEVSPSFGASDPVSVAIGGPAVPDEPPAGGGEGEDPGEGDVPADDPGVGSGAGEANRSPGAPSGAAQTLEPTGDPLTAAFAAFAAAALCAGAVLALARRSEKAS